MTRRMECFERPDEPGDDDDEQTLGVELTAHEMYMLARSAERMAIEAKIPALSSLAGRLWAARAVVQDPA